MKSKGLAAEALAAEYLGKKGYKILKKNFHSRFGEIDLIALDKNTIVFVEVKYRSSDLFGTPLESITHLKIKKMEKTAHYFLTINNLSHAAYRFDAIEIKTNEDNQVINQVKNITL